MPNHLRDIRMVWDSAAPRAGSWLVRKIGPDTEGRIFHDIPGYRAGRKPEECGRGRRRNRGDAPVVPESRE